ncbi:MAG: hypothetical protein L3K04_02670 [Thermoplasmata archaeon]|nr:hypothetical protein [Thermoplasmata archaeon]MCI4341375.1 hypothetical protein [Thermoplasmata archaeon]
MSAALPVEVRLPEPMLRRARFGPFETVTDALKFLLALVLGAVAAALSSPVVWLPFVGGGFLLATYRPDGKALDERCSDYLRWRWRSTAAGGSSSAPAAGAALPVAGGLVAGLEVAGAPLAYLPAPEQSSRFSAYRSFLDSLGGPLWLEVGSVPVRSAPFLPPTGRGSGDSADLQAAARAYRELLLLLLRRRRRTRVRLLLEELRPSPAGRARLARQVAAVEEQLARLELSPRRLRGGELAETARALRGQPR